MDIGRRVKALRTSLRLSQRQLAQRSGVTNSMISMIEQNRISPSISSLKKVLDGLSITLAEFFAVEGEPENPIFFKAAQLREITPLNAEAAAAGAISFRQVGATAGRSLQVLYERYAPGADTGAGMYSHDGEEAGVVIAGAIEITVEDRIAVLEPGDAYAFESRLPHRFRNPGSEECVIVSACTPPSF